MKGGFNTTTQADNTIGFLKGMLPQPKHGKKTIKKELLLCVWWNSKGIVHHDFMKLGETVNAGVDSAQLERDHSALLQKQPSVITRRGVILQHDDARPHIARTARDTIIRMDWEVLPHPPYSSDLRPSDYHLFLNLQNRINGKIFASEDLLKNTIASFFEQQDKHFFKKCIYDLPDR